MPLFYYPALLLISLEMTSHSPPNPVYKPNLVSGGNQRDGFFVFSTSHPVGGTTPPPLESSGYEEPISDTVSFVFKIETQNTTAFIWKVSMQHNL